MDNEPLVIALLFTMYFISVYVCAHYDTITNIKKEFDKL